MELLIIAIVGLVVIAGAVAPVWLLRGWVQRLERRAQLRVGLAAWMAETVLLVGGLLLALSPIWLPETVAPDTLTLVPDSAPTTSLLIIQEIALVGGLVGALALLARVWGVPSWDDVGLGNTTRRYALQDTLFGLALGPVAVGVFLVAGLIGGWNRVTGLAPLPDLLGTL